MAGEGLFKTTIQWLVLTGLIVSACEQKNNDQRNSLSTASISASTADTKAIHLDTTGVPVNSLIYVTGGELQTKDYETGVAKNTTVQSFYITKNLITVAEFHTFIQETGYITEAERFGNSTIFDFAQKEWALKDGAYYLYPFGKDQPQAQPDHPVTQVSWNDANAYAKWKGFRLPTAAEWEWAARSAGTSSSQYAWGETMKNGTVYHANFWQGSFPEKNTQDDGFLTTSPVGQFGSNPLGLTDMGGNVWQWTSDDIAPTPEEAVSDPAMRKLTKGGSFLCDPKVCHGFKVTGKSSSTPETGMVHTGFRCVAPTP